MKQIGILFLLIFGIFLLSGCENINEHEDLNLTDTLIAEVNTYINVVLPDAFNNLESIHNQWEVTNQEIAIYEGNNQVLFFERGNTNVIIRNQYVTYTIFVEVVDPIEVNKDIDAMVRYIRDNLNTVSEAGLDLITTIEGYDFAIDYVALHPDILTLNGEFVRGLFDQFANLEATIVYKGYERRFIVPIKIDKIPLSEQKQAMEQYIESFVDEIIEKENGTLPSYYEPFGVDIFWLSSYPGVISSNNNVRRALEAKEVHLYAIFRVAGEDVEMKFTYTSVGTNTEDKWQYIDEVMADLIPNEANRWINLLYENSVDIIEDIVYPNTITRLRPGTGTVGTKMPGGPQYVVIHDTGMSGTEDNAEGLSRYIHSQANSEEGRVASWHFSIDDTKVFQHVPTDEIAWHAGDGSQPFGSTYFNTTYQKWSIGGGNRNGIGIETCINPDNDYELTLKRTAKLTASLLHQYGLGLDRIKQHYHFSGKPCPNIIRSTKGMWESFLRDCEIELFLLHVADQVSLSWENSHPEIIKSSGLVVTPIHDTTVHLTLNLSLDGVEKTYQYQTLVKGISEQEKISRAYYKLLIEQLPKNVTNNIDLPLEMPEFGVSVTWSSNQESVLSATGEYQKPQNPTVVILTAQFVVGSTQETKTFHIQVS